ncbi:ATP-binding cassette domain-containing protein, partial [Mesorhizobium sp.]|uniref:ATP-binding cassette domain-containing protein n=1 Tax=Mesorhizobium sp. TaxID=1871066 RepID=UPI0032B0228A
MSHHESASFKHASAILAHMPFTGRKKLPPAPALQPPGPEYWSVRTHCPELSGAASNAGLHKTATDLYQVTISSRPFFSMSSIISISGVTKTYATGFKALKEINLDIERGEIFALLGPNGAGKTT